MKRKPENQIRDEFDMVPDENTPLILGSKGRRLSSKRFRRGESPKPDGGARLPHLQVPTINPQTDTVLRPNTRTPINPQTVHPEPCTLQGVVRHDAGRAPAIGLCGARRKRSPKTKTNPGNQNEPENQTRNSFDMTLDEYTPLDFVGHAVSHKP